MLSPARQQLIQRLNQDLIDSKHGSATLTIIVKNGEPVMSTYNLIVMKRRRYKMPVLDNVAQ